MPATSRRRFLAAAAGASAALAGCRVFAPGACPEDLDLAGEWPQHAGGPERSGYAPGSGTVGAERAAVGWRVGTGSGKGAVAGPPSLDGGDAYVGGRADSPFTGHLSALDLSTGTTEWSATPAGAVQGAPAVGRRIVTSCLTAVESGVVHAFTVQGQSAWRRPIDARLTAPPAHDVGGRSYVGDWAGRVHAFGLDGRHLWTTPLEGGAVATAPAVADGRVYVVVGLDPPGTRLVALDALEGTVAWTREVPVGGYPVVADGRVVVAGRPRGGVVLDAATGDRSEALSVPGETSAPAVADGVAHFVAAGGTSGDPAVHAVPLDGTAGRERWTETLPAVTRPPQPPVVTGDGMYVPTCEGLVALDREGVRRWTWSGDAVGAVAPAGEGVVVTLGDRVALLGPPC